MREEFSRHLLKHKFHQMNFTYMLSSGATPQMAATTFAEALLQRCSSSGQLCLEVAANFINECFKEIGFNYTITADELEKGGDYQWPQNMRLLYVFKYSSLLFVRLENFLQELCTAVHEQQQEYEAAQQAALVEGEQEENPEADEYPVEWLMQLVAVWCNVYKHLLKPKESVKLQLNLEEPVARINYNLLVGMHKLRKLYRDELPILDEICNRLYGSAVQGISFKNSHLTITKGLLDVFENDFPFFHQHSADTLNFYYHAFSVKGQKDTYLLLYQRLQKMLHTHSADRDRMSRLSPSLLILTGFLIQPHMQQVYFATLKLETTKKLVVATLKFLSVLQSKLLSLDCFSKDFIEHILTLIFDTDQRIVNLAAEVAVVMMRRKLQDDIVLKNLIELYLKLKATPEHLSHYVRTLWSHFPYMQTFDVYLKIIVNENTEPLVVYITCHMILAVHELMVDDFEKYRKPIAHLLEILPHNLKKLTYIETIAILMHTFANTDLSRLKNYTVSFMQILINFEEYIVATFNQHTNLQFPLYFNLITQLHRCFTYTKNFNTLEDISVASIRLYDNCERQLKQIEEQKKSVPLSLMHEYCHVLTKLDVLLNTKYDTIDYISEIFNSLRLRLIDTQQIYDFAKRTNSFVDVYAIEAITACLVKLSNRKPISGDKSWLTVQTKHVEKHLIDLLSDIENLPKMPLLRIKAIFNSLVRLYCTFTHASLLCRLDLKRHTYHLLVQTLIDINIKRQKLNVKGIEETQVHPKRIHEYQQSMFRRFIKLHTCVRTSSKVVWKLCIYYSLHSHKFNAELAALLQTLARHQLKMYNHIAAVVVFNLYKRKPALTDQQILNAIRAHSTLIDKEMHVENPGIVKVHIVLAVLQIIAKSLNILEINADVNRLKALKHLNAFVDNLSLSTNTVNNILAEAKVFQKYLLTSSENKYLKEFLSIIRKYANVDQDETVDTTMDELN